MMGIASSRNPTFNTTIGQESDLRAYNMYAGFIGYATTFALLGLFVGIFFRAEMVGPDTDGGNASNASSCAAML